MENVLLGNCVGMSLIISLIFLGKKKFNGFASKAKIAANLKLIDFDSTIDKKSLTNLSLKGLL